VLELTVAGGRVSRAEWVPAVIRSGVPRPASGAAAASAIAQWNDRRACTGLAP
jgi:hypothetical protein